VANLKRELGQQKQASLPHSDAKFTQLFKGQNFECLAQEMKNIFQHIVYVPTVIRFDNMSTAVKAIQGSRGT
jgi:transposase